MSTSKAVHPDDAVKLEDIPNVGPATAEDLRRMGIETPAQLSGQDPFKMYDQLCRIDNMRYDPCVLDVFLAAVHFIDTGESRTWWSFTKECKRRMLDRSPDT